MSDDLVALRCISCDVLYGINRRLYEQRQRDGRSLWCTNGHTAAYTDTEADKLRRERDRLKQETARLAEERDTAARAAEFERGRAKRAEAATKRLKKRAAAGNCPACKRTFANMASHMKHMHPEFVCETGAKVVPIKRAS